MPSLGITFMYEMKKGLKVEMKVYPLHGMITYIRLFFNFEAISICIYLRRYDDDEKSKVIQSHCFFIVVHCVLLLLIAGACTQPVRS